MWIRELAVWWMLFCFCKHFFFHAEDRIRVLVRSRRIDGVYKRQVTLHEIDPGIDTGTIIDQAIFGLPETGTCPVYTSDAVDDRLCGGLGGRRFR